MDVETEMLVRRSRRVAVHRLAEGRGDRTVVFCHAAPGSGVFDPEPGETGRRDVTLVALDRPGYGGSDPVAAGDWATVASAADDIAEVLDGWGIRSVGVAGWSAGGRVALALAARRPDLVARVAVVGTPAPNDEVPWIPPDLSAGLETMRGTPPGQVHEQLAGQLSGMIPSDPRSPDALGLVGGTLADESTALARPGARERLGEMLVAAFRQGPIGLAADIAGYTLQDWGFEPAEVRAKTLLLYGANDPIAGSAHARWWKRHLPDARVEMVPGAGHLLIIPMWRRVLSHLAPHPPRDAI